MELLGPAIPIASGHSLKDAPLVLFDLPETVAPSAFTPASRPEFVATFRQIISGLTEQIALVDEDWKILAVNPAWIKTAAMYGYDSLTPGTDYLAFCDARAAEGHRPAAIAVDGIRAMERNGDPSFRFTYHGKDRWEGFAFQLCVNRIEVGGRIMHTITRYDVTELVNLRLLREEFSHSLIEHQAEERRRIAREVHDSTMQLLAGLGLSIAHLKETKRKPKIEIQIVDEMEQLLGEAQRELRTISFLAHPPMVSELGLATAIRQLAGGFAKRTGLKIVTNAEEDIHVSPAAEVAVYRVVQEALSNVHRHARATHAAVGIYLRRSMLHIAIVDNGIGMPERVRKGVGLSSMRERIDEIGGRLMSRHGKPGTVIIASVPTHPGIQRKGDLAIAC